MKTPTWVVIIGILLMMFGGCGITKGIQHVKIPSILDFEKNTFDNLDFDEISNNFDSLIIVNDSISQDSLFKNIDTDLFENIGDTFSNMFGYSDYYKKWIVRIGYAGILIYFIYLLSGLFLLLKKPFSIKLVYFALILSIVFKIGDIYIMSSDLEQNILSGFSSIGGVFSMIIDVILIIVVAISDQKVFKKGQ